MSHFQRRQTNFLECWKDFQHLLKESTLMLFLDFDGTLASIVEHPEKASLVPEMKVLLNALSRQDSVTVTVVTGRSLEDIRQKVGIDEITYIANHGFEIKGLNVHFNHPFFSGTVSIYSEIEQKLKDLLDNIPGVLIENKNVTLSIHYRIVPENKKRTVRKTVQEVVKPYVELKKVTLRRGKEVLEVRPAISWDKGKAVLWLLNSMQKLQSQKRVIFYIGDDETDEDAFKALHGQALTIRVGESQSSVAKYYLNDERQVYDLLSRIAEIRR